MPHRLREAATRQTAKVVSRTRAATAEGLPHPSTHELHQPPCLCLLVARHEAVGVNRPGLRTRLVALITWLMQVMGLDALGDFDLAGLMALARLAMVRGLAGAPDRFRKMVTKW